MKREACPEPDLPEWAMGDFGYRMEDLRIGRYGSEWFIDEAGDPGLTGRSRRYFVMSAVSHRADPIDFRRAFDGVPRSINPNGTSEVHLNSLLREHGFSACMRLTAQIGREDIVGIELIVDKRAYRGSSATPRDLYQASLDVILECIDGIDLSLRKVIAIDENSYISEKEIDCLNRPDRIVIMAKSYGSGGIQIADAVSSSYWLEFEPNPGQQRKGLSAPLREKSVNLLDGEEPGASHWRDPGADSISAPEYKRTIFDRLRALRRRGRWAREECDMNAYAKTPEHIRRQIGKL